MRRVSLFLTVAVAAGLAGLWVHTQHANGKANHTIHVVSWGFILGSNPEQIVVRGLLVNGLSYPATNITVTAAAYNKKGKKIAQGVGGIEIDPLKPGGQSPFEIIVPGTVTASTVKFKIQTSKLDSEVEVLNYKVVFASPNYYLEGTVENTGYNTLSSIFVSLDAQDKHGKTVGESCGRTQKGNVSAGATDTFYLTIGTVKPKTVHVFGVPDFATTASDCG